MTIYVTTGELSSRSVLPKHFKGNYIPSSTLETHTGADVMITPKNYIMKSPNSVDCIKKAVRDGAILVQLKFGHDFPASIGDRMNKSHMKMCKIGASPNQRVLLALGVWHQGKDGILYINATEVYGHINLSSCISAMIGWSFRGNPDDGFGGSAFKADNYDDVGIWLDRLKKSATSMHKYKLVNMADKIDIGIDSAFGQLTIEVNDIRNTWATVPGIGGEKAHQLYNMALSRNIVPNMDWFKLEVIDNQGENLPGFGKGIAKKAKEWLYKEVL